MGIEKVTGQPDGREIFLERVRVGDPEAVITETESGLLAIAGTARTLFQEDSYAVNAAAHMIEQEAERLYALLDRPGGLLSNTDEARSQGQYEQILADRFERLRHMLDYEDLIKLPADVLGSAVRKAGHLVTMLDKALESAPGETSESYAKACNLTERLEDALDGISPCMDISGAIGHLENAMQAIHEAIRQ